MQATKEEFEGGKILTRAYSGDYTCGISIVERGGTEALCLHVNDAYVTLGPRAAIRLSEMLYERRADLLALTVRDQARQEIVGLFEGGNLDEERFRDFVERYLVPGILENRPSETSYGK